MLQDQKEIDIMSTAGQQGLRSKDNYPTVLLENIINDFVEITPHGEYLDIGAGHWDFADIVKKRGGVCEGIDYDPCVIELGNYRDYVGYNISYTKKPLNINKQYNGIFSRGSINPASYGYNYSFLRGFIDEIDDMIKLGGWGLIIPWYSTLDAMIETKDEYKALDSVFISKGYTRILLTHDQMLKYGCELKGTKYLYIKTRQC